MSDMAMVALVGALLSMGLQVIKDHLSLDPKTLRWVAVFLGLAAGGLVSWQSGPEGVGSILTLLGVGAGITAGTHSIALQGSFWGNILKAVGTALFRKTPNS